MPSRATVSAAAMPVDPYAVNSLEVIRARAYVVADGLKKERLDAVEIGYSAVWLSLFESANQIRALADKNLSAEQLRDVADRLDALAESTITLGEAETGGGA